MNSDKAEELRKLDALIGSDGWALFLKVLKDVEVSVDGAWLTRGVNPEFTRGYRTALQNIEGMLLDAIKEQEHTSGAIEDD